MDRIGITMRKPGLYLNNETPLDTRGYWLVTGNERSYISPDIDCRALERVCRAHLSDAQGWDYWIDYCLGRDVTGRVAWCNIDQSDRFL
jgi:hypothetical protein